jgi:hypothetical protein
MWREKVGLRNCKDTAFIYLRLYNCSQDGLEFEEGEACVRIKDLAKCKQDSYQAVLMADDENVGTVEFRFDKIELMADYASQGRNSTDNSFSLPQIKRDSLPLSCRKRTNSIATSEPIRQHKKFSERPAGHKSKSKLPTHKSPMAPR